MTLASGSRLPLSTSEQRLVDAWITNADCSDLAHHINDAARADPEFAWQSILAAVEIPEAADLLEALAWPLSRLIALFGPAFIDRIEAQAAANTPFRECLRVIRSDPVQRVPEDLWPRLSAAAGSPIGPITSDTSILSSEWPDLFELIHRVIPPPNAPDGRRGATTSDPHACAEAWVRHEQSFWAWLELDRLQCEEGLDVTWRFVLAIVDAGSDEAVCRLGAGVLEKLVGRFGADVITRTEAEAAGNQRFRFCLSHVWPYGIPEDLWKRIELARMAEPQRG